MTSTPRVKPALTFCCPLTIGPTGGKHALLSTVNKLVSYKQYGRAGRKSVLITPLRSIEVCSTSLRADYLLLFIWIYEIIYFYSYTLAICFIF